MRALYLDFNSIKVRLNPKYATKDMSFYSFQFHKGTIKPPTVMTLICVKLISIP